MAVKTKRCKLVRRECVGELVIEMLTTV